MMFLGSLILILMRASDLFYYGIGFTYVLLAGEILYFTFKFDDYVAGIQTKIITVPAFIIVVGLVLIGFSIMLLGDPNEYSIAKLLGILGVVITLAGIGSAMEYVARYVYYGNKNVNVLPIYISKLVAEKTSIALGRFIGAVLLIISILPATAFIISEYERSLHTGLILLNLGAPTLSLYAILLVIPYNHVTLALSATIMTLAMFSLMMLDLYEGLSTIPAE